MGLGTEASSPGRLGVCVVPAKELRVVAPWLPPSIPLNLFSVPLDGLQVCPYLRVAFVLHPCIDICLPHLQVTSTCLQKNSFFASSISC